MTKKIAIFDLDNTLLGGDSDHLWGQFLIEKGVVNGDLYQRENDRFYQEYVDGTLNIHEFLSFSLQPLASNPISQLKEWRSQYLKEKIEPIMLQDATALLKHHRDKGATLLIITATNRFITEPIAAMFGVEHLLATEPEIKNGAYTGKIIDPPCFQHGKVERLELWLKQTGMNLTDSWFYSDSHNDLPLLEQVTRPVAVDPDDTLLQHADAKGWPVISLRESS